MRQGPGQAGLSVVLTRHLDRMSRMMTEAQDGYLDIGREVAFYVELGWWEWLRHDSELAKAWQSRNGNDRPVPDGMVVQEATWRHDLYILGLATRVYVQRGLLAPMAIPHGEPLDSVLLEAN